MISFEERSLKVGCLVDSNAAAIYEDPGGRPLRYLNVQKLSPVLRARSCWCSHSCWFTPLPCTQLLFRYLCRQLSHRDHWHLSLQLTFKGGHQRTARCYFSKPLLRKVISYVAWGHSAVTEQTAGASVPAQLPPSSYPGAHRPQHFMERASCLGVWPYSKLNTLTLCCVRIIEDKTFFLGFSPYPPMKSSLFLTVLNSVCYFLPRILQKEPEK